MIEGEDHSRVKKAIQDSKIKEVLEESSITIEDSRLDIFHQEVCLTTSGL